MAFCGGGAGLVCCTNQIIILHAKLYKVPISENGTMPLCFLDT